LDKQGRIASILWKGWVTVPDNLLIDTALIPGLVAVFAAGLLWFIGGADRGYAAAAGAIGIGFIAGYLVILGPPPAPPAASTQKLFYVVAVGVTLGVLLDLMRLPPGVMRALGGLAPLVIVGWFIWPRLLAIDWGHDGTMLIKAVAFAAIAGAVLASLYRERGAAVEPGVMILVAAMGLAGLAFFGSSAVVAQLSGVVAASAAGLLLWNWPFSRHGFGAAGILGAGGALMGLTAILLFFSETNPMALAVLTCVFLAGPMAERLAPGRGGFARAMRPVALGAIAAIPALAAMGVAFLMGGADSGY
jgi:hypothetical protein